MTTVYTFPHGRAGSDPTLEHPGHLNAWQIAALLHLAEHGPATRWRLEHAARHQGVACHWQTVHRCTDRLVDLGLVRPAGRRRYRSAIAGDPANVLRFLAELDLIDHPTEVAA